MLKILLIALFINIGYAQPAQRSPYSSQYMYYFYSKAEDNAFRNMCDKLGIKYGGAFIIVGKDTLRFTQANDSMHLFKDVVDKPVYLGKGVEDVWISKGAYQYIKFKEFIRP